MENNKKNSSAVVIVILVILVIVLGGYIGYDKLIVKDNNSNSNTVENTDKEDKNKENTVEKDIEYVFDENKIYNIGGYWYYNGNNNVEVKRTTNNKTYYDFYKINYHNIDFTNLTKVSKWKLKK